MAWQTTTYYVYCDERGLVGGRVSNQAGAPHTHQSVLVFEGILEFIGRQFAASSVIFSEPQTQRKTTCLFGC